MEIKEIVSYYLNNETNILDVSFRTIDDTDEVFRNDNIDFEIVESYGFDLITESFDFFGEEFEDELDKEPEATELDEHELIVFLNEYYTINPDLLPRSVLY
jgi:hypothetical protein